MSPRRRLARRLVAAGALVAAAVASFAVLGTDDDASGGAETPAAASPTPTAPTAPVVAGIGPYDPTDPLDLSGVAGVSAAEQEAAEGLVADVTAAASAWTSVEDAEAAGYRSIGDSFTGEEHLVDWSLVGDGIDLDPARPEALVYDVDADGGRTLVAAMFLRPPGSRAEDAPDVGGRLTTWHPHGDLCLDEGGAQPFVGGVTDAAGRCPGATVPLRPLPALHVWLVAHPCGPFAELEGVGVRVDPELAEACTHRHGG